MISEVYELGVALMILGAKSFALLLMALGAVDLYGHFQERKGGRE